MSSSPRRSRSPQGTRTTSHPDSDMLFTIKKHLNKKHHIRNGCIQIEPTIKIKGHSCIVLGRMSRQQLAFIRGLVHTPDIVVVNESSMPTLIIEYDGISHNSPERIKKDESRNEHYKKAGIPYIVLNSREIRSLNLTPLEYLDTKMVTWNAKLKS